MRLLLTSYLHPELDKFLSGRIVYINDAASAMLGAPFAQAERNAIADIASELVELTIADTNLVELERELVAADGVYVAGGEAFALLCSLKTSGADGVLIKAIRNGLPYVGTSAGSVITGPSIEPMKIMDDPSVAPDLTEYDALGLVPQVVVPHAQGTAGPYTIEIISKTVERYGKDWNLLLLRDGQALLVDDDGYHLV